MTYRTATVAPILLPLVLGQRCAQPVPRSCTPVRAGARGAIRLLGSGGESRVGVGSGAVTLNSGIFVGAGQSYATIDAASDCDGLRGFVMIDTRLWARPVRLVLHVCARTRPRTRRRGCR